MPVHATVMLVFFGPTYTGRAMSKPSLLIPGNLTTPRGFRGVPVDYITEWVRARLPEFGRGHADPGPSGLADRVLIVQALTGSGKSTALPAAVFRLLRGDLTPPRLTYTGPTVLCTQPRVLTAIFLAHDLDKADYMPDMILGKTVGHHTGSFVERPPRGLVFATAGLLLAQLRGLDDATIMAAYRIIIVDEAHERSTDTDTLIALLKAFLQRNVGDARRPLVILASATIDVVRTARFFGLGRANTVEVRGRAFPVRDHFPVISVRSFIPAGAELIIRLHQENDDPPESGDIMMFVPGRPEGVIIKAIVDKRFASFRDEGTLRGFPATIIITGADIKSEAVERTMIEMPPGTLEVGGRQVTRRIIIATNVAETGLTIESLKYVVDSGWNRQPETYPPFGLWGVVDHPIAQSRIHQRKGRAGRKFPGEFYPLYTRANFGMLPVMQLPDIVLADSTAVVLEMFVTQCRNKAAEVKRHHAPSDAVLAKRLAFRIRDVDMLDTPPALQILAAIERLLVYGFISSASPLGDASGTDGAKIVGWGPTPAGIVAARFSRENYRAARLLMSALAWGVSISDAAIAAACLNVPRSRRWIMGRPPRPEAYCAAMPKCLEDKASPAQALWRLRTITQCDFVEVIVLANGFIKILMGRGPSAAEAWCADVGVDYSKMAELLDRRNAILDEMAEAGMVPPRLDAGVDPPSLVDATHFVDLIDRVRGLKRCLVDTLGLVVLELQPGARPGPPGTPYYSTRQGVEIDPPYMFAARAAAELDALGIRDWPRPTRIIADDLQMKAVKGNRKTRAQLVYTVKAANVTAVDGWVGLDPAFYAPADGKKK